MTTKLKLILALLSPLFWVYEAVAGARKLRGVTNPPGVSAEPVVRRWDADFNYLGTVDAE